MNSRDFKLGIVVGEVSGDNLAASAVRAIKENILSSTNNISSNFILEGICGPKLIQEGGHSLFPMEKLSVMGLIEPLIRIPEIALIRRRLIQHFIQNPPNVFLGVDSSTFNLGLELKLKNKGIKTAHYVCPTVWAWRKGRIKTIQKGIDLMLALFPFEARYLEQHGVPVCLTGHPLADEIPLQCDTAAAKKRLGYDAATKVVALLPGSRNNELQYLGSLALQTAKACLNERPDLQFAMALVSEKHKKVMEEKIIQLNFPSEFPIQFFVGQSREVMQACDVALVTSGTATLELMLFKKPMAVMYRMNPITYQIAKRIINTRFIALPNVLSEEELVPEFIQEKATVGNLSKTLLEWLDGGQRLNAVIDRFDGLHRELRRDAAKRAATAILEL